jgi:hypothetical protein
MVERPVGADVDAEVAALQGPLALDRGVRAEHHRFSDGAGGDPVARGDEADQGLAGAGRERHPGALPARGPRTCERVERLLLVDPQHDRWLRRLRSNRLETR